MAMLAFGNGLTAAVSSLRKTILSIAASLLG